MSDNAPQIVSSEAEDAFNELIAYLDSLASCKAGGDETAQTEIETNSTLDFISVKYMVLYS